MYCVYYLFLTVQKVQTKLHPPRKNSWMISRRNVNSIPLPEKDVDRNTVMSFGSKTRTRLVFGWHITGLLMSLILPVQTSYFEIIVRS